MITILLEKIKALLSELKTNIENMPKGGLDYSLQETEIGTWIDGRKVYRKVIYKESIRDGNVSIEHGITNLDMIINTSGCVSISPVHMVLNSRISGSIWLSASQYDDTSVDINAGGYTTGRTNLYLVIDYVKTED